eukprot:gene20379-27150_t
MDATYKVTKWGFPIFLLTVVTNHGHGYPAGMFFPQEETSEATAEALLVLKGWNPKWKAQYFIILLDEFIIDKADNGRLESLLTKWVTKIALYFATKYERDNLQSAQKLLRKSDDALNRMLKDDIRDGEAEAGTKLATYVQQLGRDQMCYKENIKDGTCSCPDQVLNMLVCKHMFGVLHDNNNSWSFDKLPQLTHRPSMVLASDMVTLAATRQEAVHPTRVNM